MSKKDIACHDCGSRHMVKCVRPMGKSRYLCKSRDVYFSFDAERPRPIYSSVSHPNCSKKMVDYLDQCLVVVFLSLMNRLI